MWHQDFKQSVRLFPGLNYLLSYRLNKSSEIVFLALKTNSTGGIRARPRGGPACAQGCTHTHIHTHTHTQNSLLPEPFNGLKNLLKCCNQTCKTICPQPSPLSLSILPPPHPCFSPKGHAGTCWETSCSEH